MNNKAKIKKSHTNKDKDMTDSDLPPIDLKQPIDMKLFWKQINQHHFTQSMDKSANDIHHLVNYFSMHDSSHDYVYAKTGFPCSFAQFAGKALDSVAASASYSSIGMKKNNPVLITKLFGLFVYVDNGGNNGYGYANSNCNVNGSGIGSGSGSVYTSSSSHSSSKYRHSNINFIDSGYHTTKIKDEICFLEKKMEEIERNNINHIKEIKENGANNCNSGTSGIKSQMDTNVNMNINQSMSTSININSDKNKLKRFDNLIDQIFRLQMKQFSESISGIKKYSKGNNRYLVQFDPSEQMDNLTLDEEDYNHLISFRDLFNSVSVHDLFQEKTFSYYNTSPNSNTSNSSSTAINAKAKKETIEIAKKISINYNYCHHCKQIKPGEVTLQCKSGKGSSRPHKAFIINNTTVVRKSRSLIIKNFEGDPKEFIECTDKTEIAPRECKRFFCHFCLKGSYDAIVDEVKLKKDWQCPYCTGVCFCSRCTRYDKILKLIGLYVSLGGELNVLYDSLITKSDILDKLNAHMLLSNLIVVINDPSLKPMQIIKNLAKVEVKSIKKIDALVSKCDAYKENLAGIKEYYDKVFMKAKIDKCLLGYDKSISDLCLECDNEEENGEELLKRKRKKYKVKNKGKKGKARKKKKTIKEKVIKVAQMYWKKDNEFKVKRNGCSDWDYNRYDDNDNDEEDEDEDEVSEKEMSEEKEDEDDEFEGESGDDDDENNNDIDDDDDEDSEISYNRSLRPTKKYNVRNKSKINVKSKQPELIPKRKRGRPRKNP